MAWRRVRMIVIRNSKNYLKIIFSKLFRHQNNTMHRKIILNLIN